RRLRRAAGHLRGAHPAGAGARAGPREGHLVALGAVAHGPAGVHIAARGSRGAPAAAWPGPLSSALPRRRSATATSTAGHEFVPTVVCEDAPGIVPAVPGAIVAVGGNISESRQSESGATHRFHMRLQVRTSASAAEVEQA